MRTRPRLAPRLLTVLASLALIAAACGSDDPDNASPSPSETLASATSTTVAGQSGDTDVRSIVEALAADDLGGRVPGTEGSTAARALLIEEISQFAEPAFPDESGDEGFLQAYDGGTSVLGVIAGDDRTDEYVLIGAHYDHLGSDCDGVSDEDEICNGAADNAAGMAAAIEVARAIATDGPPSRSVILAFWDGEEVDFGGSVAFVEDPVVSLDQIITYINFDIQGVNLLPSLANATVMVGSETGGPALADAASAATEASTLDTIDLSLLFGQGRSDHAVLVDAGVPSVFFTDANSGCYHTVDDEVEVIDFDKLDQQIVTATALAVDLVATDEVPEFDPDAPATTFDDAAQLLRIVSEAEPDFGSFSPEAAASSTEFLVDLQAVVDAGEAAFDDAANEILLGGAVNFVEAIRTVPCDGHLG